MSTRYMTVECPRCGKHWHIPLGQPDIDCNCHLYCEEGDDPSDCSVTQVNFNGQLGWPQGLHNDPVDEGEHVRQREYYCSTHNRYYYKKPIIIEADWQRWFSRRAPKKFRMSHGEY